MFYQLREVKRWWWVNKPEFKFWSVLILICIFGIVPWIIGIGIYIKLFLQWIF